MIGPKGIPPATHLQKRQFRCMYTRAGIKKPIYLFREFMTPSQRCEFGYLGSLTQTCAQLVGLSLHSPTHTEPNTKGLRTGRMHTSVTGHALKYIITISGKISTSISAHVFGNARSRKRRNRAGGTEVRRTSPQGPSKTPLDKPSTGLSPLATRSTQRKDLADTTRSHV